MDYIFHLLFFIKMKLSTFYFFSLCVSCIVLCNKLCNICVLYFIFCYVSVQKQK